ncbi:serine acetyltransferase [Tardiphaga robiniae]|uniref:Serine acetyltransferase n=1 Tax=Tardiphaga robiniae TaxID=943830 RepID=A0A7G6TUK3_9BRAD|nr:serine acetyltransferase [Tardiphaga robiniae]QND70435.1 serine acetyltransferase [Tardiphaga robiniae]
MNRISDPTAIQIGDEADWSREVPTTSWDPGRKLLRAIRRYQYWRGRKGLVAALARKYATLRHRFWSVMCGADIPLTCCIGGGLLIPHPNGIVIHPDVTIGVNCLIFQQTTLGIRDPYVGAPHIGSFVDIGAGAKILGPVTIGKRAKIGANAVVLNDVAPNATAKGVH